MSRISPVTEMYFRDPGPPVFARLAAGVGDPFGAAV
jgi:hypothetical protein